MMSQFTFKLILTYDGSRYGGWQIQPNTLTIQEIIQNTFYQLLHEKISLVASGRTDAGVHAINQVAHFRLPKQSAIPLSRLALALNRLLPMDIRIKSIEEVPNTFHARYSALKKSYSYHINLNLIQNPFNHLYSYHFRRKLDLDLLQKASTLFVGTHDFTSFANESHRGSAAKNSVKTLYRLDISENRGDLTLLFEGNGFLYKMVRNIVNTLLNVGTKKLPLETISEIFEKKDRRACGSPAPARGLFLVKVEYQTETLLQKEPSHL